jgi:hypothetical protein
MRPGHESNRSPSTDSRKTSEKIKGPQKKGNKNNEIREKPWKA